MAEIYRERFADPDGRVRATFEIIWISGWAPHESQQKPLKPGSATASLGSGGEAKDALRRGRLKQRPDHGEERALSPRLGTWPPVLQTSLRRRAPLPLLRMRPSLHHSSKSIRCGISGSSAGGIG